MLDHLPERDRPAVKHQLRAAWARDDHDRALDGLHRLAAELDHHHPGAAASLREGLEETVTLTRLGITGNLRTTLQSTNAIESMSASSDAPSETSSAGRAATCVCAGRLRGCSSRQQFRRIIGYSDPAKLSVAVERDIAARRSSKTLLATVEPGTTLVTA